MDRAHVLTAVGAYAAARSDIAACYVFGSVARGTAKADSDVDVAVLFDSPPRTGLDAPRFTIARELAAILSRPVDVIQLQDAPVDLVHRVMRDGVIVHESDKSKRIAFEIQARNAYFDLLPYLLRYRGMKSAR